MDPSPPLSLGDAALDEDHERLHQRVVELRSAPREGALPALDALLWDARAHFDREDADLRLMAGGNAQCHLDEHGAVLRSLNEVRAVLMDRAADAGAQAILVARLSAQLLQWLPMHIQEMDAAVVRHRAQQRFGGAPVRIARAAA